MTSTPPTPLIPTPPTPIFPIPTAPTPTLPHLPHTSLHLHISPHLFNSNILPHTHPMHFPTPIPTLSLYPNTFFHTSRKTSPRPLHLLSHFPSPQHTSPLFPPHFPFKNCLLLTAGTLHQQISALILSRPSQA